MRQRQGVHVWIDGRLAVSWAGIARSLGRDEEAASSSRWSDKVRIIIAAGGGQFEGHEISNFPPAKRKEDPLLRHAPGGILLKGLVTHGIGRMHG